MTLNPNQSATLSTQFDPSGLGGDWPAIHHQQLPHGIFHGSQPERNRGGGSLRGEVGLGCAYGSPDRSPVITSSRTKRNTNYRQLNSAAVTETTYVDTTVLNSQT